MNRYIKLSFAVIIGVLLFASCTKQLDINNDPSRLTPGQATVNNLLPSGEQYLASAFYTAGEYGNYYPQYLGGAAAYAANIDSYNAYGFNELWGAAYLSGMPNYYDIISRADQAGAPQFAGIGRLMMALTLMQSTDIWGDVPYKEAFQGAANLSPHYDAQQDIYNTSLLNLLNKAIDNLNQPIPTLASLKVGTTDLIYTGNIPNWIKAAYAARARYYLHLSGKTPADYQLAINDAKLAFSDQTGAADLQLFYNQAIPNPWFTGISNASATSRYARPSKFYVNLMNGTGAYAGLFDPRLPKVVDNGGKVDGAGKPLYVGRPVGTQDNDQSQGANLTNVDITTNTYYGQRTSPIPVITYAEVQFIMAESYFNSGDKQNAYNAYLAGIKGSMIKWGVATTDMNTYINSPLISKGFANLTLSDIMLQKYIALFLQMETWTDMRRYQYDTSVYVGLTKPFINNLGGAWVQRGNYADIEPGTNPNVPKSYNQLTELWLFTK